MIELTVQVRYGYLGRVLAYELIVEYNVFVINYYQTMMFNSSLSSGCKKHNYFII